MEAGITPEQRETVIKAIDSDPVLARLLHSMVDAVQTREPAAKSNGALERASDTLPEPKTAPTMTIEQMKEVLRAADCLYDDSKIWNQLGAKTVPAILEAVIQEAYEKGGRVILQCSSISEKANALREANHSVSFWGSAKQSDYQKSVSKPQWIVVPSHIDESTLGNPKSNVVTSEMPAPTPEDWFSGIAYARLDGRRQPKGCERRSAFTTETGTVVGSNDGGIDVSRSVNYGHDGFTFFGAARFGPPRN